MLRVTLDVRVPKDCVIPDDPKELNDFIFTIAKSIPGACRWMEGTINRRYPQVTVVWEKKLRTKKRK